jgi:hypothetical protein
MTRLLSAAVLLFLSTTLVSAQAMLESMVGAATGTAGAVAGRSVSNALDGVLRVVDGAAKSTATAAAREPNQIHPSLGPAPVHADSALVPQRGGSSQWRSVRASVVQQARVEAFPLPPFAPLSLLAAPPEIPPFTVEQIARIQEGTSRADVVSSLGRPTARIVIPAESGRLTEIYTYATKGQTLGNLRLTDGVVTSVKTIER